MFSLGYACGESEENIIETIKTIILEPEEVLCYLFEERERRAIKRLESYVG